METYGKPFKIDGIEYVHTMVWYKRPIFKLFSGLQWLLWKIGIDWHMNLFGGQCTPNGSCCKNKYRGGQ